METTSLLKQIESNISTTLNNNYESYLLSKKEILLVAISFDDKERNIKRWDVKNLEK